MNTTEFYRVLESEKDEEVSTAAAIIGWIGTGIGVLYYLFPVRMIYQLFKGHLTYKEVNVMIFITNTLNCLVWTAYGKRQNKPQLWIFYACSVAISGIWTSIYWVFFAEKHPWKSVLYLLLFYDIGFEIFYIFYEMIHNITFIKYFVCVVGVIMYYTPGLKMYHAIKLKNRELIQWYISFTGIFSNGFWFIYGLLLMDFSLIVTKGIGTLLGLIQTIVWVCLKCKYPDGDPEKIAQEKNKELEEKKEGDEEKEPKTVQIKVEPHAGKPTETEENLVSKQETRHEPQKETIEIKERPVEINS